MAKDIITRCELDAWLAPGKQAPESFGGLVAKKITEADRLGLHLEVRDPEAWRVPDPAPSKQLGAFLHQFRRDVDQIMPMDRSEEGRLARSIEFARKRLEQTCQRLEVKPESLEKQLNSARMGWGQEAAKQIVAGSKLPKPVAQRWVELQALRVEFVERNLYLVLINVERYAQKHSSRVDLIQEGCISLFRAVDGFDWRRGLLFRTYAVHWLNQAFRNHLYNFGSTIRVPVYLQKVMRRVREARIEMGNPKASVHAIAKQGDLSEHLVSTAIQASRASFSLDVVLGPEGGSRIGDLVADPNRTGFDGADLDRLSLERNLGLALEKLEKRERFVLKMRFGLGVEPERTLAEVAGVLDLSIERVRQIQLSALRKLGAPGLRHQFEAYLN